MASDEKPRCPSCGGIDTRHSYPGGALDMLMEMFSKRPYRCRGCRRRFYSRDGNGNPHEKAGSEETVDQEAEA